MNRSKRILILSATLATWVPFAAAQVGGTGSITTGAAGTLPASGASAAASAPRATPPAHPTDSVSTQNAADAADRAAITSQQAAISAQADAGARAATVQQGTRTPNPGVNTGSSTTLGTGATGASVSTGNPGVGSSGTVGSASARVGGSGVGGGVTSRAGVAGQATPSNVGGGISTSAGSSLNTFDTVHNIRSASDSNRNDILRQVEANRDATAQRLLELNNSSRALSGEARQRFDTALSQVRARETALRRSLEEVRSTSGNAATEAQARLAADYETYAQAVTNAQAAAELKAKPSP